MLTTSQIKFLNNVCKNQWYEINDVINVNGDVSMINEKLTKIPVQFGQVYGHFYCNVNRLTTLIGTPSIIKGCFNCDSNKLTTLEGGPKEVSGYYSCCKNQLTNLIGAPEICHTVFDCSYNKLTSLEGCPVYIKSDLDCQNNPDLKYVYGIGNVEKFIFYNNSINDLNRWIVKCAGENTFVTYSDIAQWIKDNSEFKFLLQASEEIRQYFSKYIIKCAELNLC